MANVKAMSVYLSTGEVYRKVSLISDDPINALAFLKIERRSPEVPLGDSNNVKLGDEVLWSVPRRTRAIGIYGLISWHWPR